MLHVENVSKTFFPGTINEKRALQNLSLHLASGDFATVIGGNGAGKSTTLNAIAGVFPVDKGKIIIDGEDITKKPEHKRAKYIGRVFQDPMLGTAAGMMIEENLALAARRGETPGLAWSLPEAQHDRFYELLKELDLGLEDRMTAKVGLLSGGQRQRLAIARAILKNPRVLILDEATSALDTESEKIVQDALDNLMVGRTSFVIAHRLSTIFNADQIFVVENGHLREHGTHEELLAAGGLYSNLYNIQFRQNQEG